MELDAIHWGKWPFPDLVSWIWRHMTIGTKSRGTTKILKNRGKSNWKNLWEQQEFLLCSQLTAKEKHFIKVHTTHWIRKTITRPFNRPPTQPASQPCSQPAGVYSQSAKKRVSAVTECLYLVVICCICGCISFILQTANSAERIFSRKTEAIWCLKPVETSADSFGS